MHKGDGLTSSRRICCVSRKQLRWQMSGIEWERICVYVMPMYICMYACMYVCMYVCECVRTYVFVRVSYHERVFECISASACANSRFRSASGVSKNSQQRGDKTTCEGRADSDTAESMPVASLSAASLLICALYHRVKNMNTSTSALQPPSYPSLDPCSFLFSTWKAARQKTHSDV